MRNGKTRAAMRSSLIFVVMNFGRSYHREPLDKQASSSEPLVDFPSPFGRWLG